MKAEALMISPEVEASIRKLPHGEKLASKIWAGYRSKTAPFRVCLVNSDDGNPVLTLDKHSELLFILLCFVVFRDCGKSDFQEIAIRIATGKFHAYPRCQISVLL